MSDTHTEAAHIAASLESALRRSAARGKRRVAAPTKTYTVPRMEAAPSKKKSTSTTQTPAAGELCSPSSHGRGFSSSASTGILFVGESMSGSPQEAACDEFLTRVIENGIGVKRSDVYIIKLISQTSLEEKPSREGELVLCSEDMRAEIDRVSPKAIVALGERASCDITQKALPLERLRSESHRMEGRSVIPTYSPAEILQKEGSPDFARIKKLLWEDIQQAMREAGVTPRGK